MTGHEVVGVVCAAVVLGGGMMTLRSDHPYGPLGPRRTKWFGRWIAVAAAQGCSVPGGQLAFADLTPAAVVVNVLSATLWIAAAVHWLRISTGASTVLVELDQAGHPDRRRLV